MLNVLVAGSWHRGVMPSPDVLAMKLASTQGGVITRRQAIAVGMTDRMIQRRTRTARWERVAHGVYAAYPAPFELQPLAVAVAKLAATVSHESAAELHGFGPVPKGKLVVTVPHRLTNRCAPVVVHESTDLRPDHVTRIRMFPVTTPERTIIDLAAVLRPARLRAVANAAVHNKLVDASRLFACFSSVARRGKPGVAALREVLAELADSPSALESELERRFHDLVRSAGLPEPAMQLRMPWRSAAAGRVDFAFAHARLVVECDGRRWHTAEENFESDRRRDNLAQLAGWRVLRFTWRDMTESPTYVVDAVRSALALRPVDAAVLM